MFKPSNQFHDASTIEAEANQLLELADSYAHGLRGAILYPELAGEEFACSGDREIRERYLELSNIRQILLLMLMTEGGEVTMTNLCMARGRLSALLMNIRRPRLVDIDLSC
ncbi:MAG: hypothetical protein OEY44_03545 [Candidatus Peregrinibacteria bacterium]|nr:hypothetical protein [Candidatus Peregrinibacteria bacterium]